MKSTNVLGLIITTDPVIQKRTRRPESYDTNNNWSTGELITRNECTENGPYNY